MFVVTTRRQVWIVLSVAVAGSLLYFYFDPSYSRLFPPCLFYAATGFFCPGCGSQRAFHDLLRGHFGQACGHNMLFMIFLPFMLFAAVVAIHNIFRRKKIGQDIFYSPLFTKLTFGIVVVFWVLRNLPFAPFNILAP